MTQPKPRLLTPTNRSFTFSTRKAGLTERQRQCWLVLLWLAVAILSYAQAYAQQADSLDIPASRHLVQQLRGQVVDPALGTPVAGATVQLAGTSFTTLTGKDGSFRLRNVPVGKYTLQVTHAGMRSVQLPEVAVWSGKETVLTVSMEPSIVTGSEVVVKSNSRKNRPINEMSLVSARAFTVEETARYAAAVNDPARMAMAFPGVMAADDGNNHIVIRGNAPNGLLWRMEGVDIPNPNHFASTASSGGGISILSAQLLSNSDFLTGAFAAEYGNALSGVFDLRLRKGNNERREYTVQAGVLGLNLAAEGPFSRKYGGSYLVNYRY
ncbi:MAG TPA: carboxypeptidase regulatory-like domain-containing protein, partial [Chitinophagaceae bacterium]|nr:carboxypeptidase regulatory-like domain-containing protein [Chitinophagaceae bacterium]